MFILIKNENANFVCAVIPGRLRPPAKSFLGGHKIYFWGHSFGEALVKLKANLGKRNNEICWMTFFEIKYLKAAIILLKTQNENLFLSEMNFVHWTIFLFSFKITSFLN